MRKTLDKNYTGNLPIMDRPYKPRQKDVLLVCDQPFNKEVEVDEAFSSIANTNLLTSLRTGRLNNYTKTTESFNGIPANCIHATYLDYETFTSDNTDYILECKKKKDLHLAGQDKEGVDVYLPHNIATLSEAVAHRVFYKLPHQKDVYISLRLYKQLKGLLREIELVQPKLIIVVGKWSLFFLHGGTSLVQNVGNYKDKKPLGGLNKFRASILQPHECWGVGEVILYPMFHTLMSITMPDKQLVMEWDIGRACWIYNVIQELGVSYFNPDNQNYIIGVDHTLILSTLDSFLSILKNKQSDITFDIETRFSSTIDCVGLSIDGEHVICIPFSGEFCPNIWTVDEEFEITWRLLEILQHNNANVVAQNGNYDCQFFYKLYLADIRLGDDTLILNHLLYNYLPKSLDFLASLFAPKYSYWKNAQTHGGKIS